MTDSEQMDKRKRTITIIKFSILLLIIIGAPVYLYINYRDTLLNPEWLAALPDLLRQYSWRSALVLMGLQILQVIICVVPGQPIQIAASYLFGVFRGYLISITGAVIGATIAFYLAKLLGKDALELFFDKDKIEDYQRKLNSGRGLLAVLIIYLIPGLPKDLVGYVAGISDMNIRSFLIVSTIGRTPPMLGSLLFGHFASSRNYTAIAVLAAITLIILVICFIKRKELVALLDSLEDKGNNM